MSKVITPKKRKSFSVGKSLMNSLEETMSSAQEYSGQLNIEILPIDKILFDPDNPRDLKLTPTDLINGIDDNDPFYERKVSEKESIKSLSDSIKNQGLINPILVYRENDCFRLIAGERRTLASLLAKAPTIQAKIIESKPNKLKVSLLQWVENIQREDLSLHERVVNLNQVISAYLNSKSLTFDDLTLEKLSELIGCAKSQAAQYRDIIGASDHLKHLIQLGKIDNVKKAAFIARSNILSQDHLIELCLNGGTLDQLKKASIELSRIKTNNLSSETRGRSSTNVKFGSTKNIEVAKKIVSILLNSSELEKLNINTKEFDLNNTKSINSVFKLILSSLEKDTEV